MVFKSLGADLFNLSKNYKTLNVISEGNSNSLQILIDRLNLLKDTGNITTETLSNMFEETDSIGNNGNLTNYFKSVAEGADNARVNIVDAYAAILDGNTHGLKNVQSIFNTYNEAFKNNEQGQKDFTKAVGQSNSALSGYLKTVGTTGKAKLTSYAGYLAKTTAKTVGLQIASTALNAVISLGLSAAISGLVMIISEAVNSQEELREKAIETADAYKELSNSTKEIVSQYESILDSEKTAIEKTKELNEWKKTLVESYGFEESALMRVNEKREEGIKLLNQEIESNKKNTRNNWLGTNKEAIDTAVSKMENVNPLSFAFGLGNVSDSIVDLFDKVKSNEHYVEAGWAFDFTLEVDGNNLREQYDKIQNIITEIGSISSLRDLTVDEDALLKILTNKSNEIKKVLDEYETIYDSFNDYTALNLFEAFEDSENYAEISSKGYDVYRETLLKTAGGDKELENSLKSILLEKFPDEESAEQKAENLIAAYNKRIENESFDIQYMSDAEKAYYYQSKQTASQIQETAETIEKSVTEVADNLDDFADTIEEIDDKSSLLSSAFSEMEDDGKVSLSTIQKLTEMGEEYVDCLYVENGQIKLNIQAYKDLAIAKEKDELMTLRLARAEIVRRINSNYDAQMFADELAALDKEIEMKSALIGYYEDYLNNAGGGDTDSSDPIKAAFEKEYNEWQHLIATGETTVDEFITWLDQEYKDTFSDLTKYQEEYNKYEEEVYNARKKREQELFDLKISNHETLAEILTDGITDSEIKNFNETMQSIYGLGNVDLTKRPMVNSDTMRKAGYDVEDGSTATVYSGLEFLKQGDKYVAVHYTPILPDGTVLDKNTLYDYLDNTLNGSQNILDADNKGIVLKVDSGFEITEEDIKSLEDGIPTENISNIIKICDEWDISLHDVQASWVELQNAINGNYSVSDELRLANEQLNYALEEIDNRIAELRKSGKTDVDEEIQELLGKKQSIRDTIDNNNVSIVENEKTYWENLKQEVEDYYDKEIEKLQSILDEEEKINKQEELRNNLIKARQDLENAKKNRNQLVFANGSFEYTVDQEAVEQAAEAEKDAQRELERFKTEQKIKELDEQRNEKLDDINAVIEKVDEHLKELNGETDPTSSDSQVIFNAGATEEANKAQDAYDSLGKDDKSDTSTEVKTDTVVIEYTGQFTSDDTGIQGTKQLYTIDEAAKILADRLGVSVDSDVWKNFATSVVSNSNPQSSPLSGIQNQNVYNNSMVDNSIRIGTINNNVTVAEGTTKQQVQSMLDGFASEVVGSLKSLRTKTT